MAATDLPVDADDMERLQSDVSDIKRMVSHPASSARQAAPH
jgi:hypothetical protein